MPRVSDPQAAIEVRELVREFRKGPRAVDGIDLAVSPGEIYGFLGPNGAGKSTTVLMLTTLLPPTSGRASVGGFDIVRRARRCAPSIGAALQEAALDRDPHGPRAPAAAGDASRHTPRSERRRAPKQLLERVGLTEAADRRVGGYSGGMKRRLDLALALVHAPRILFLDEPTTGLDPQSRAALWEEVARLAHDEGMTVFLTTQYLEEADVLADRIGIIDHGRIVAEGTPAQLKAEIGSPSVEVTPADAGTPATCSPSCSQRFGEPLRNGRGQRDRAAARRRGPAGGDRPDARPATGLRVETLQLHQPSLDDVFLAEDGPQARGRGEGGPSTRRAAAGRGEVSSWALRLARIPARSRRGAVCRTDARVARRAIAVPAANARC